MYPAQKVAKRGARLQDLNCQDKKYKAAIRHFFNFFFLRLGYLPKYERSMLLMKIQKIMPHLHYRDDSNSREANNSRDHNNSWETKTPTPAIRSQSRGNRGITGSNNRRVACNSRDVSSSRDTNNIRSQASLPVRRSQLSTFFKN
jgi:hypothetical protein